MKTSLFINDVFEAMGSRYRLLHVVEAINAAYVHPFDNPELSPQRWEQDGLDNCAGAPEVLRNVQEEPQAERPIEAKDGDVKVRDRRWNRIKGIVNDPRIWEPDTRKELLKTHAAAVGSSPKTLLRDLQQWWEGGQLQDALLGDYFRCGRIDESTDGALAVEEKSPNGTVKVVFAPAKDKARGANPKDKGVKKFSIPAEVRAQILEVAKKHYLADASRAVHGTTTAVLDDLFSLKDDKGEPLRDDEERAVLKPPGQRPTFDQVRYLIRKALPLSKAFKDRHTPAEYENNHAPSIGSVLDDCQGAGDVFEIDSTIIDVYNCARANRAILIGKATLYLVIDRETRLVVGFYLSLEPPSWAEATQAILSIACDWEALCKRLGIKYRAKDWPARGVMPNRFFADRGDMIAYASNALCDGVATQVTNAKSQYSRGKPLVESGFLTLSVSLRENVPGYEPPTNPFKRRGKKYHKDGSVTLDELAAIVLRAILKHNRSELLGYQAKPEEIAKNLPVNPIALFERQVAKRMGTMARMPIELLRRKLMPTGPATMSDDGIHFNGLIYKPEGKALDEWFTRASLRGKFDAQVRFTANLVDEVIVLDPFDARKQYVVGLTTTSEEFAGYSFAEVKFLMDQDKANKRAAKRSNEGHAVALRQGIRSVTEPANTAMNAAAKGLTPGMRQSGGDDERATEGRARRQAVHGISNPDLHYGPLGAASDTAPTPDTQKDQQPTANLDSTPTTPPAMPTTDAGITDTDPALLEALVDLMEPQ